MLQLRFFTEKVEEKSKFEGLKKVKVNEFSSENV